MSKFKTPLRYPGGKQRLWPFINEILVHNDLVGGHYVEPYAGGAGVAIELLLRNRVTHIHLNDSSLGVFSFWHSILNDPERFCRAISRAVLTVEEWKKQKLIFKESSKADRFDLGFATFYLNRCNRSGILNGGVIGGLAQTGNWKIDARFPRNDLINRVEAIAAKKRFIKIKNLDAERFLSDCNERLPEKTLVYCDPPYYRKAESLYHNHYKPDDHCAISDFIQNQLKLPWVVSYDSCEEIEKFYANRNMFRYQLQYNAATVYKGSELFIFSDELNIPESSSLSSIQQALE